MTPRGQVRLQNDRLTLLVDLETGRITDWRDSARPEVAPCELGAMGFLHAPMVRLLNAEAEDGPAGILLFGLVAPDVSVHQWIWVQASGAEVEIETRWVNEGYASVTLERPLPVLGDGLEPVAEAQWRRDSLCVLGAVSPELPPPLGTVPDRTEDQSCPCCAAWRAWVWLKREWLGFHRR